MITLTRMAQEDYQAWFDKMVEDYSKSKTRAGVWNAANAFELAKKESERLLFKQMETPNHIFWNIALDNKVIGSLWVMINHYGKGPDRAWIFNIEIDPIYQGKGYGREVMMLLESEMQKRGVKEIELNVFAYNTNAIKLYRSLGYQETAQQMKKVLDSSHS